MPYANYRLGVLEEPFVDVQVSLDLFLMHTAVPYTLDSIKLSLIFRYPFNLHKQ